MVITFANARIPSLTGSGSSAAPSALEVAAEVFFHLAFGLGKESEIPAIAQRAGGRAHGEGSRVPERIEQARPAAELLDALGAPGEVVLLFQRRLLQRQPVAGLARGQRLALVERLGADLADVVDAHQRRGVRALGALQCSLRDIGRGRRPLRPMHARQRAKRNIESPYEPVYGTIEPARRARFSGKSHGSRCAIRSGASIVSPGWPSGYLPSCHLPSCRATLKRDLDQPSAPMPLRKRAKFPVFDSKAAGPLRLTNAKIAKLEADEDARRHGRAR